eukprot:TRINITY_DN3097_c4_g1_i1.p1 TRINITY_DN3097_c4_g1~~TRINITY_DN3097_c4_g1_i1.p1  ORF type:complete len:334 (+),score=91.07 TRINITY_DN3097_c4_g1_i1:1330-2331(+)
MTPPAADVEDQHLIADSFVKRRCGAVRWPVVSAVLFGLVVALAVALTLSLVLDHPRAETRTDGPVPAPDPSTPTLPPPLRVANAAVAADNPTCPQVGSDIMRRGGNAVDAAVATCLCQGVLNPFASGIGGGMIMTVRMADGTVASIDGREQAPAAASKDMFVANPKNSSTGALSIAVSGELAGLEHAWNRFRSGNVSWADVVRPSWELANSHPASRLLVTRLTSIAADVMASPAFRRVYAPNGRRLVQVGETVSNPELSQTLQAVAQRGASAFYTGSIAQNIVDDVRAAGGILSMADLANYAVKGRALVETFFHGLKVLELLCSLFVWVFRCC